MKAERWERIWTIFESAVAQPAESRSAFLDTACGDDTEVRSAVQEMLEADAGPEGFLDQPVIKPIADAVRDNAQEARAVGSSWGPTTPERIGSYRILRPIGQGGMGMVFLAVRDDDSFDRRVVVKLVRHGMGDDATLARLRVERQILASLDHPNIARLYDGGSTDEGAPYFVMEYVEGVTIDAYCEQNALSVDDRVALFLRVCDAVRYAHQNLVVHRDIKPANIMVTAAGEPKLLDFGIAKLLNPELSGPRLDPTVTWQRALTPSYASPEQIRGQLVTTTSDVYSLGVLLYKLLTGRVPHRFGGRTPAEIERLVTDHPPPPPSRVVAETTGSGGGSSTADSKSRTADKLVPPAMMAEARQRQREIEGDLDAIVLKALRAAPQQRYSSVEQLADDLLRRERGLPVHARHGTWRYRAGKLLRRHRTAAAVTLVSLLLLAFFGVAMARQSTRVRMERDQARIERDRSRQMVSLFDAMIAYAEPYEAVGADLTVREAIVRSVPVIAPRLETEPNLRAHVLQTTGAMLARLGVQANARAHLEEALEIRRARHGEGHPEVIETTMALASVLKVDGELAVAETMARDALAQARETYEVNSPRLVAPLNALISVLCFQDRFADAENLARESLSLAPALGQDEADQQIYTMELMAGIHKDLGRDAEAEPLYRDALARRHATYGEQHPAQQSTLHNLGAVLRRLDRLDEAERAYSQALTIVGATYGEAHYEYATTLNGLAGVRFTRGDYAAAMADYERTLAILQTVYEPDALRLFFVEQRIEVTRARLGQATEAERNLRAGLVRLRPIAGADHWLVARGESMLGEVIAAQGRLAEAAPLLESSYRALVAAGGQREARNSLDRLVPVLEQLGRGDEVPALRSLFEVEPV